MRAGTRAVHGWRSPSLRPRGVCRFTATSWRGRRQLDRAPHPRTRSDPGPRAQIEGGLLGPAFGLRPPRESGGGAHRPRSVMAAKARSAPCIHGRPRLRPCGLSRIPPCACCARGRARSTAGARHRCARVAKARCSQYRRGLPAHAAGPVAQWLEPAAHNGLVGGSSPSRPTIPVAVSTPQWPAPIPASAHLGFTPRRACGYSGRQALDA